MDSLWRGEVTFPSLLALFAMNILLNSLRKRAHHRVWVVELIAYSSESVHLSSFSDPAANYEQSTMEAIMSRTDLPPEG
jgi:hypothetical protein